jgi:predicted outer membrane lipoprotein
VSTRFAATWFGGAAVLLGAVAARAATLPDAGCWEGIHPSGYTAAQIGAVAVAVLLVLPSLGLIVAVEPRRPAVRWILGTVLAAEFAAAIALFAYLRGVPTYHCG